jgi:hypothetical protein
MERGGADESQGCFAVVLVRAARDLVGHLQCSALLCCTQVDIETSNKPAIIIYNQNLEYFIIIIRSNIRHARFNSGAKIMNS